MNVFGAPPMTVFLVFCAIALASLSKNGATQTCPDAASDAEKNFITLDATMIAKGARLARATSNGTPIDTPILEINNDQTKPYLKTQCDVFLQLGAPQDPDRCRSHSYVKKYDRIYIDYVKDTYKFTLRRLKQNHSPNSIADYNVLIDAQAMTANSASTTSPIRWLGLSYEGVAYYVFLADTRNVQDNAGTKYYYIETFDEKDTDCNRVRPENVICEDAACTRVPGIEPQVRLYEADVGGGHESPPHN
jgi:hypothetical protein